MREQNPQAAERRAKPVSAYRDFPTVVAHPSQSFSSNSNSKDELHPSQVTSRA